MAPPPLQCQDELIYGDISFFTALTWVGTFDAFNQSVFSRTAWVTLFPVGGRSRRRRSCNDVDFCDFAAFRFGNLEGVLRHFNLKRGRSLVVPVGMSCLLWTCHIERNCNSRWSSSSVLTGGDCKARDGGIWRARMVFEENSRRGVLCCRKSISITHSP